MYHIVIANIKVSIKEDTKEINSMLLTFGLFREVRNAHNNDQHTLQLVSFEIRRLLYTSHTINCLICPTFYIMKNVVSRC